MLSSGRRQGAREGPGRARGRSEGKGRGQPGMNILGEPLLGEGRDEKEDVEERG